MQFDEALKYLLSLGHETLAIKLGLANVERLLDALDRPQNAFPAVQIAGTNGKCSTAAMLDAICHSTGDKTGLYTSPHLVSITERIRIGGQEIAPDYFAQIITRVREAALRLQSPDGALPTFFEQVTAVAFVAFREAQVQLAILETGLGGRLDAVTAARATTIVITPIALDHQQYLGQTLAEIAAEKVATIHRSATVIIAPQLPEVLEVVQHRCRICDVTPRYVTPTAKVQGECDEGRLRVTFGRREDAYANVCLSLRGRHQITNAAVAIEAAESLREYGFIISREAIIEGLERAKHPGRLEIEPGAPPLIFDGAHNAAGAQALRNYLDEFVQAPITFVFGAMNDKDLTEIGATLFPAAHHLILTQPESPRAASLETLTRAVPSNFDSSRITLAPTASEALRTAREQTPPEGVICVTGSLYLIGEIMKANVKR